VLGTLNTGNLSATSTGNLNLGQGTVSGTLAANSNGGAITQAGGLTVTGASTVNVGAGNITLGNATNDFQGAVTLTGAVTQITDGNALVLGTLNTGNLSATSTGNLNLGQGTVSGTLAANSNGGAITQAGGLTVTGASTVNAGAGNITLGNATNDFQSAVTLTGAVTQVTDGNALVLGTLNTGNLSAISTGNLNLGQGTVSGTLAANSNGGAITQAGGLTVTGASTINAGAGNITLGSGTNDFQGAVNLTGGISQVTDANALLVGGAASSLTAIAGTALTLAAGSYSQLDARAVTGIGQSGPLSVSGLSTLTALNQTMAVNLGNAANDLGAVQLASSGGGSLSSVTLTDSNGFSVTGDAGVLSASTGGSLTLGGGHYTTLNAAAVGGLQQSAAIRVGGTTTVTGAAGMAVDLSANGSSNELHVLNLLTSGGGSLGTVQVRDNNALVSDGLQVGGNAADLRVSAAGPVTLNGGSYGALRVDTSSQNGNLDQTAAITVSGLTELNTGAGDASLTQAANDLGTLAVTAGKTVTVVDANNLQVAASQVSSKLDLSAPGLITFTGPLSGAGALQMRGAGTLLVDSAHTYTGGTTVSGGTLSLQGPAAQLGSGGTVLIGAAGTLTLGQGAVLPQAVTSQGGTLSNLTGSGQLTGALTLLADTTVQVDGGAGGLNLDGGVGDAGSGAGLRKTGAGTLSLGGVGSYAGATQVDDGTLRVAVASAIGSGSAVNVAAAATLSLAADQNVGSLSGAGQVDLQSFTLGTGNDLSNTTFSGAIQGSGGLNKVGSGRFTLSGSNLYSGQTTVSAGELALLNGAALADSSAVSVAGPATLIIASNETLGSLAGNGTVRVEAPLLTVGARGTDAAFSGQIQGAGGLLKTGAGQWTLSGSNGYAGATRVAAGVLQLASAAAAAPGAAMTVDAAGTLDLQTATELGSLAGAGTVALHGQPLSTGANNSSTGFSGNLVGSGSLTKLGTGAFTLSGNNSFSGPVTVSAGQLVLAGGSAVNDTADLTVAAGASLGLSSNETLGSLGGAGTVVLGDNRLATGGNGSSTTFSGVISGSGGISKEGAGVFTLSGGNTYSGVTQIDAGTLQVGAGGTTGSLGTGAVSNQGVLNFERSDAITVANAVGGTGSLRVGQGKVSLSSGGNNYSGDTVVAGGELATTGAEKLSDTSTVRVASGARLTLAGNETVAALLADGNVSTQGSVTSTGDQLYRGSFTVQGDQPIRLTARTLEALNSANQWGAQPLSITANSVQLLAGQDLQLGELTLANGGQITADRLSLAGNLNLAGGTLNLSATASPDLARAVAAGAAQVPGAGVPLVTAEATVVQQSGTSISVANGAQLAVVASGGGSVTLAEDSNQFNGSLSVLSGPQFNTAWSPNVQATVGVQSLVNVAGGTVNIGGAGLEADLIRVRADRLSTSDGAVLAARMPYDDVLLGTSLSAPGMVLELSPTAFSLPFPFGQSGGQEIKVSVGSQDLGGRTGGFNAGFLTIRPKDGASGSTAVFLVGPQANTATGGYRFFHDGSGKLTEIPVFYNGYLPQTPQLSGALSSVAAVSEAARKDRFEETVRTENVAVRLRAGVIAEVGPGRPATVGTEGARLPEVCSPASDTSLNCP
jgi:autotransporter-associated beta strand protein